MERRMVEALGRTGLKMEHEDRSTEGFVAVDFKKIN